MRGGGLSLARPGEAAPLEIGLVNNMPDGAFAATERQFARVLGANDPDCRVRLHRFCLPEIARRDVAATRFAEHYLPWERLFEWPLDGLVVTGSEPRTEDLRDEAYWPSLRRLTDWAQHHTRSTIWSCLAAHATVLHLHGIERVRLERKLSGVFRRSCTSAAAQLGLGEGSPVPHSRLNGLPHAELVRRGYQVAATIVGGEVDSFMLDARSRFVFVQGHPEYEPGTLAEEYLRDVRRHLSGRRPSPPPVPANYFTAAAAERLHMLSARPRSAPPDQVMAEFEKLAVPPTQACWRASAADFYGAWLDRLEQDRSEGQPALRLVG